MDDRFLVVGELNRTKVPTDTGFKWNTYTENVYVWFGGQWQYRVSSRDCMLDNGPFTRSGGTIAEGEFSWRSPETGEYVIVNFACPLDEAGRLDTKINKLNSQPSREQALEWELAQEGYDGNCLVCGGAPFYGEVPFIGSGLSVEHDGLKSLPSLSRADEGDGDAAPTNSALSTGPVVLVALLTILVSLF